MENLTPYLRFNGQCEEALNFYKDCFDGEITLIVRYSDAPWDVPEEKKNEIMHSDFKFWAGKIMACDQMEKTDQTANSAESNIHLNLGFTVYEDRMRSTWDRLKIGGTVTMKLEKQFWGDIFGMLTDKYGICWMFDCVEKEAEKGPTNDQT
ncbi:glyoxalase/bleomycin resistance/extradiol dioxygenase family protein [bacterium]|nr:glyoxalase/bleomycin resistance/extradiol dioxygenase family protein [bacterium]